MRLYFSVVLLIVKKQGENEHIFQETANGFVHRFYSFIESNISL